MYHILGLFSIWICVLTIIFCLLDHKLAAFRRLSSTNWPQRAEVQRKLTLSVAVECDLLNTLPPTTPFILLPNAFELNKQIIRLFGQREKPRRRDVQSLLSANLHRISSVNAVTLMHRSSKIGKDVRTFLNESLILAFLDPSLHDPLDAMGICNCLYGLKNFNDKHTFTTEVIVRLISQVERLPEGGKVTALGISNSLYGMKSFSWQGSHSIRLLQALQSWIIRSHSTNSNDPLSPPVLQFTPQTLSNCFLGLQSLPPSCPLKTWFMQLLSQSMDRLATPLDAFSVSSILLGLKETDSRYIPARNVVAKIVDKCQRQPDILYNLDGRKLSMSIWGLQGMVSEQREVADLLAVFNHRIEEIMLSRNRSRIEALKLQSTEEVGLLLGGLRGLSGDSGEVRRFLFNVRRLMMMPLATSLKFKRALRKEGKYWIYVKREEKFLASAFHGLQRLDDGHDEVRGVLRELTGALAMDLRSNSDKDRDSKAWSFGSICTALYGKRHYIEDNQILNLVKLVRCFYCRTAVHVLRQQLRSSECRQAPVFPLPQE